MDAVKDGRTHTMLRLDRALLEAAKDRLGARTFTETVDIALRQIVVGKPRVLGASERRPVARQVDEALDEMGFDAQ